MSAEVELSATLLEKKMTLREIMNLKAGDIIPVELPEKVVVDVAGLPTFRAKYGQSRDKAALKILEQIPRDHIIKSLIEDNDNERRE
jgi:flagellar motor switch protein FliM